MTMHMTANKRSANADLRETLQKWLAPSDPSINHNIARKAHHNGTASWFFQGSIFKQWKFSARELPWIHKRGDFPLLWIHGKRMFLFIITPHPTHSNICSGLRLRSQVKPSCGISCYCCVHSLKLSPSSGIIEDIMTQHGVGLAIMAYFYCDFRDEKMRISRTAVTSSSESSELCAQSNLCYDDSIACPELWFVSNVIVSAPPFSLPVILRPQTLFSRARLF